MIPDWPSRSATMYVPYAAATDSVSSTRWSSTAAISRDATQPATSPIAVLATMIVTTETTTPAGVTLPTTTWTAIVNTTSAVPSLNRLSLSMSVARRRGEPSCLNVETTATGSVAATHRADDEAQLEREPGRDREDRGNDRRADEHAWRGQQDDPAERPPEIASMSIRSAA